MCRSICRSLFCLTIHINILFVNIYFYLLRIIADYFADVVGNGRIDSFVRFYDFRSCTFQHLCRTPGFRGCVTMSLRRSEATEAHFREIAADFVLATFGIAALPSVAPKKQQYHWSKDVGAVPRTAQQARSGIGPYELKAVSSIDNPGYGRGQWLAMTKHSVSSILFRCRYQPTKIFAFSVSLTERAGKLWMNW